MADVPAEGKKGRIPRLFGWVGLHRLRGKGLLLTRRLFVLFLAGVLVVLAGAGGFFYYSNTPEFCNSCHIMEPYVASWKTSSHKDVACVKCHFPPGWNNVLRSKFVASRQLITYAAGIPVTRLNAEIDDAACLRGGCHETRLIEGKVLFKKKYTFDHGLHLGELRRGKQLRCTSCHSQIVQGDHIAVTESVCFTCHFKGHVHERMADPIAGCTSCHEPPTKPIRLAGNLTFEHEPYLKRNVPCWKCHVESVQGQGNVPPQVCLDCHGEPEKLEKYSDSKFMHDWHVTRRKVECFQCHSEIRHGLHPQKVTQEDDGCAMCHSGGHSFQASLYSGQGGKGVKDMPSRMFLANVDCIGCHEVPMVGEVEPPAEVATFRAAQQACVECHGAAYGRMLEQWKEVVADALAQARNALAKAEVALQNQPAGQPQAAQAKGLLDAARYNCDFVERAHGVHNVEYALEILAKAEADAAEAARLVMPTEASRPTSGAAENESGTESATVP